MIYTCTVCGKLPYEQREAFTGQQCTCEPAETRATDGTPVSAFTLAQLNAAVTAECTCGGNPPGPLACPACAVYHRLVSPSK